MDFLNPAVCVRSVCQALEAYAVGKIQLKLHTVMTEFRVPKTEIWCSIWFVFPHVLAVALQLCVIRAALL
jgi:hypothetical protein